MTYLGIILRFFLRKENESPLSKVLFLSHLCDENNDSAYTLEVHRSYMIDFTCRI